MKPPLTADELRLRGGNSDILNQSGIMNILRHVSCFYPKSLAKMVFRYLSADYNGRAGSRVASDYREGGNVTTLLTNFY